MWLLVLVAKPNKSVRIDVIVDAFLVCTYSGCSLPEKRSHGSYRKILDWTEDESGPSLCDAACRAAAAWPAEGSTSLVVEKGEDGGDADAARSYDPLAHMPPIRPTGHGIADSSESAEPTPYSPGSRFSRTLPRRGRQTRNRSPPRLNSNPQTQVVSS